MSMRFVTFGADPVGARYPFALFETCITKKEDLS